MRPAHNIDFVVAPLPHHGHTRPKSLSLPGPRQTPPPQPFNGICLAIFPLIYVLDNEKREKFWCILFIAYHRAGSHRHLAKRGPPGRPSVVFPRSVQHSMLWRADGMISRCIAFPDFRLLCRELFLGTILPLPAK